MEKHPQGFARLLGALDFYLSTPKEIVIIGERDAARDLIAAVYAHYLPNKLVVVSSSPAKDAAKIPLLQDRVQREGKPTAYVCENFACQQPVTDARSLAAQLQG